MANSSSNSLFEALQECVREIDSYNERVHFGPLRESLGLPSIDLARRQPSPVRWLEAAERREQERHQDCDYPEASPQGCQTVDPSMSYVHAENVSNWRGLVKLIIAVAMLDSPRSG